jgi:hypothetical protein
VTVLSQTGQPSVQSVYLRPKHETFRPGESVLTPDSLPQISRYDFAGRLTIAALIVFAGLAVIALLIIEERDLARWRSFPSVDGQLTACTTRYSTSRRTGNSQPYSEIQYRYSVSEMTFTGKDTIYNSACDDFPADWPISVIYDKDSPADSRLTRGNNQSRSTLGLLLGALIPLGGVLLFDVINLFEFVGTYRRTVPKFDALKAATTIRDGTVYRAGRGGWFIDYWRTRRKNKPERIYVAFRFETPDGKTLYGKQVFDWSADREVPKRGTPVKILYASDDAYLLL